MRAILLFLIFSIVLNVPAWAESQSEELHWPKEALIFVKFMLASSGKSEAEKIKAFDDAYRFLSAYWSKSNGAIVPSSLQEYVKFSDGNRELFLNLETELQSYREGNFRRFDILEARDPQVQAEIEAYRAKQAELAETYLDQALAAAQTSTPNFRSTPAFFVLQKLFSDWNQVRDQTPQLLASFPLEQIDQSTKLQVANAFEGIFSKVMQEIRSLSDMVGQSMATPDVPHIQASVETLFGEYFRNETDPAIKNMISGLLDDPGEDDNIKRMGIVLQYAAPNLLKLLQLIARQDGISPEAVEVLTKLEDEVQGASFYAIRQLLEAEIADMAEQGIHIDIDKIDPVALKAATIGQIHLGEVELSIPQEAILYDEDSGRLSQTNLVGPLKVVFRFTKPGSEQRAEEGREIMRIVARAMDNHPVLIAAAAPKAEPMVDALYEGIVNDMDIPGTSRRHQTGIEKYSFEELVSLPSGEKVRLVFKVPHLFYVGKSFTILEAVQGDKLSSVYDVEPTVAQAIANRMSFKWFYEAYFMSGFFHADLHPGNFMAKAVKDSIISVKRRVLPGRRNQSVPTYVINVLDFGMGGVAGFELRRGVFGMMVAAMAFDSKLLAQIAWRERLAEASEVQDEDAFRRRFFESIEAANRNATDKKAKVRLYINAVNESGITFDPIMAGLMRGTVINSLVANSVKQPTTFAGFVGRVLRRHPALLKSLLMSDDLLESEPRWVGIYDMARKARNKAACWLNLAKPDQ